MVGTVIPQGRTVAIGMCHARGHRILMHGSGNRTSTFPRLQPLSMPLMTELFRRGGLHADASRGAALHVLLESLADAGDIFIAIGGLAQVLRPRAAFFVFVLLCTYIHKKRKEDASRASPERRPHRKPQKHSKKHPQMHLRTYGTPQQFNPLTET